jgi:hypothetical protein
MAEELEKLAKLNPDVKEHIARLWRRGAGFGRIMEDASGGFGCPPLRVTSAASKQSLRLGTAFFSALSRSQTPTT